MPLILLLTTMALAADPNLKPLCEAEMIRERVHSKNDSTIKPKIVLRHLPKGAEITKALVTMTNEAREKRELDFTPSAKTALGKAKEKDGLLELEIDYMNFRGKAPFVFHFEVKGGEPFECQME